MVNALISPPRSGTRQALAEAAMRLIRRKGWAKTSLAEIAREAGLTTGAIYSQFKGADELLLDAVINATPPFLMHLQAAAGLEDGIRAMVRARFAQADEPDVGHLMAASSQVLGILVNDEELAAVYREFLAHRMDETAAALERLAQADGSTLRGGSIAAAQALAIVRVGLDQALVLAPGMMDEERAVELLLAAVREPAA